jgi:anthranilate phosphoribosyltransferase
MTGTGATGRPRLDPKALIGDLTAADSRPLPREQARRMVADLLEDRYAPEQAGAILALMAQRHETPQEIAGAVDALLEHTPVLQLQTADVIDIGGTGGDGGRTFNISTVAALVVAGAGVRVIKHGNRAVSGRSGSADLIEALAFIATPAHYRFPERLSSLRRALGIPSLFNLAGPLAHPAGLRQQVIGVARPRQAQDLAEAAQHLGRRRAFIVHGLMGIDEISPAGDTLVVRVEDGAIDQDTVCAADFGLEPCALEDLAGGDAARNAGICQAILAGESGPGTDAVVMAAALALMAAGRAQGPAEGAVMARQALTSGRARQVLIRFLEQDR